MTDYSGGAHCCRERRRLLASVGAASLLVATASAAQNAPTKTPGDQQTATTQSADSVSTTPDSAAAARPDERGQVQDIVVTAQRRSERLQNVPIAITALNEQALLNAGIQGATELPKAVPGLVFNEQLGGLGQPRIRGVGVSANGPGLENPVAIYIDGVYLASAASALFDLHDVAQIAVLKGPQGTLFGRNATGGLIQVTTKDPSYNLTLDVDGTVGTKRTYGGNFYIAGGLTDRLAASLSANLDDQLDGFGVNIPTGQQVQTHRAWAARGKLLFEPDADTRFTLSADYSRRSSSDFTDQVLGYELVTGLPQHGGPRDTDQNFAPYDLNEQDGVTFNAQHDFGTIKVVMITGYRFNKAFVSFDADQTPLDLLRVQIQDKERQFSQELQLLSTTHGRFSWQVGLYYFWNKGQYAPDTTDTFFPNQAGAVSHDLIVLHATEQLDSYAAYAQGTYKLNDWTNLTAGIRFTDDKRTHRNDTTFSQLTPFPFSSPTTYNMDRASFSQPSWRISLDHHFTPEILGYLSYNRGFKSGTFNPQADPTQPITHPGALKPEILDAFEAGAKTELFERRVRLNLAGYYYKYKNIQVSQFSNEVEVVYTGQGAKMYGIDADLTAQVFRGLSVNAGVAYIHGRYDNFTGAFLATPNPGVAQGCVFQFGCGGNTVTLNGVATGDKLQNTPDVTVNAGATYAVETSIGRFALSGNYYYNDGFYSEPVNRLFQPHYNVVDASLTWTAPGQHFDIRAWGKNLTDALYAIQLAAVDTGDLRTPAPGRTFGLTAGFHF